jgi:hypothetical protein
MNTQLVYRYIPLAALFSALGVIFPIFFHLVGLGSTFLPMFLPLIAGSTLLPPVLAVIIAIITPLISFLFTGMPPLYPPILPVMLVELIIICAITSWLYFRLHQSIWLTLVISLVTDRLVLFLFILWLAPLLGFPEKIYSIGAVLHGVPGIVLIFVIVPVMLRFLKEKYPYIIQNSSVENG